MAYALLVFPCYTFTLCLQKVGGEEWKMRVDKEEREQSVTCVSVTTMKRPAPAAPREGLQGGSQREESMP